MFRNATYLILTAPLTNLWEWTVYPEFTEIFRGDIQRQWLLDMQKSQNFLLFAFPRCQLRPSSLSPWISSPSLCHRRCQLPWQLALCMPSDASNGSAFSASAHRGSISVDKSIWSALTRWALQVVWLLCFLSHMFHLKASRKLRTQK